MRLWTLHPKYLDVRGLVAAWREGLLAQAVLMGRTRGYTRHPQLNRFRASPSPSRSIGSYLRGLYEEARRRGYRFDRDKIDRPERRVRVRATTGQLDYEWRHLTAKLVARDGDWLKALGRIRRPQAHPLFRVVSGPMEEWEVSRAPRATRGRVRPR